MAILLRFEETFTQSCFNSLSDVAIRLVFRMDLTQTANLPSLGSVDSLVYCGNGLDDSLQLKFELEQKINCFLK